MSPPDGTLLYEEKQGFGWLLKIVALILAVWILTYAIIIISKHGGRQPDISPSQAFMLAMVPLPMIIFLTTFPFMHAIYALKPKSARVGFTCVCGHFSGATFHAKI